jgi:hypothetical protein
MQLQAGRRISADGGQEKRAQETLEATCVDPASPERKGRGEPGKAFPGAKELPSF